MENTRQIISCKYCEKMFQNSNFLTKHIELKHLSSFTKQSSIFSNLNSEIHNRSISCKYCEKMFQNPNFLTKHVELKHPSFTKQFSIVSNLNNEIHNRINDQHNLIPTKSKIEVKPSEFVDVNKG